MSEDFDEPIEGEEGAKQSPARRYMWVIIILAVVAAIAIPLTIMSRTRSSGVTLETLDTKLTAIETNLDGDIATAKSDVAWVKEKVADMIADVGEVDTDLTAVLNKINNIEAKVISMEVAQATLSGKVDNIITTLASCNCTCLAGA